MEKSYPGNCVVNCRGQRIANESQNYIAYQLELYARHSEADPQVPAWMVFDARFRRSYFVGPLLTSRARPDWRLPRSYLASGFLSRADTIRELGKKAGIDPDGLERTVAAMNEYARTGKDPASNPIRAWHRSWSRRSMPCGSSPVISELTVGSRRTPTRGYCAPRERPYPGCMLSETVRRPFCPRIRGRARPSDRR